MELLLALVFRHDFRGARLYHPGTDGDAVAFQIRPTMFVAEHIAAVCRA
jgi:hypothetical protein